MLLGKISPSLVAEVSGYTNDTRKPWGPSVNCTNVTDTVASAPRVTRVTPEKPWKVYSKDYLKDYLNDFNEFFFHLQY